MSLYKWQDICNLLTEKFRKKSHVWGAENTDWATCLLPSLRCSSSLLKAPQCFVLTSEQADQQRQLAVRVPTRSISLNPHFSHQLPHFCIPNLAKAPIPALRHLFKIWRFLSETNGYVIKLLKQKRGRKQTIWELWGSTLMWLLHFGSTMCKASYCVQECLTHLLLQKTQRHLAREAQVCKDTCTL